MWPVEPLNQIVLSEPKLLWGQKGTVKSASHTRARLRPPWRPPLHVALQHGGPRVLTWCGPHISTQTLEAEQSTTFPCRGVMLPPAWHWWRRGFSLRMTAILRVFWALFSQIVDHAGLFQTAWTRLWLRMAPINTVCPGEFQYCFW